MSEEAVHPLEFARRKAVERDEIFNALEHVAGLMQSHGQNHTQKAGQIAFQDAAQIRKISWKYK